MKEKKICFEWSEEKNKINKKKHEIDFTEAIQVFNDNNRLEFYDDLHSKLFEERYKIVGTITDGIIIVLICNFKMNMIRIISARKANKTEVKEYYEKNNYFG